MGCAGSRFDKRKDAAGDFNTVGLQFMGGEGNKPDMCPVDRLCMAYADKKELAEVFKPEDEEFAKKVATETYNACGHHAKYLEFKHGAPSDDKKVLVADKYDLKDAIAHMKNVQEALKAAGFEFEEEKKEEGKEEEKKDDMMAEMMEGGEGDMMDAMDAMMEAANDLYKDDAEDYNGAANLGKLLLAQSVKNPYFGDVIKRQLVVAEFATVQSGALGGFGIPLPAVKLEVPGVDIPGVVKEPSETGFAGASGLISAYVDSAEGDAKDVWFSGFVGDEDLEALKAMVEGKEEIVFPGWLSGWRSEEDAKKNIGTYAGSQAGHKVLYKINAKVLEAVVCRSFIQRLSAKIDSHEEADGWNVISLTENPFKHTTIADWEKSLGAPAETPAAEMEEKKDDMMAEEMAPEMAAE